MPACLPTCLLSLCLLHAVSHLSSLISDLSHLVSSHSISSHLFSSSFSFLSNLRPLISSLSHPPPAPSVPLLICALHPRPLHSCAPALQSTCPFPRSLPKPISNPTPPCLRLRHHLLWWSVHRRISPQLTRIWRCVAQVECSSSDLAQRFCLKHHVDGYPTLKSPKHTPPATHARKHARTQARAHARTHTHKPAAPATQPQVCPRPTHTHPSAPPIRLHVADPRVPGVDARQLSI